MLVLVIRTDKPESEIGLFQDDEQKAFEKWEAHRALAETIHTKIQALLLFAEYQQEDIEGIVVFKGPGSFTGLRIGVSVANAFAYGSGIPVVATGGEDWIRQGQKRLLNGENDVSALPEYGAQAHITQQRK